MKIIPAIDLIGGECVRLTQGDYNRKDVYDSDPVRVAQMFEDAGAGWLHLVDLDGAKAGEPKNLEVLQRIRESVSLKIEFGGGLRSLTQMESAWSAGANRLILGSILVQDREQSSAWFQQFGDRLVVGIDMKDGMAATGGWLDVERVDGLELAKDYVSAGCQRVIVTDIATDGTLSGPNLELIETWVKALSCPVIASGGVSCLEDLGALARTGAEAVIVGKALYAGRFNLKQAIEILKNI